MTPHIARHDALTKTGKWRRTSIDGRATRHPGYAVSQRVRKRIEEAFGCLDPPAQAGWSPRTEAVTRNKARPQPSNTKKQLAPSIVRGCSSIQG